MISPRYLVAFTGHRNLSNPAPVARALSEALQGLQKRVEAAGGKLEFYGSIAYGADTLAVAAARELNIPVHLILPKAVVTDPATGRPDPRKGFAADFWDGDPAAGGVFRTSDWSRTLQQIEDARAGVNGGTLRVIAGGQTAPECYYEAGMQTLEVADVLLAVWDGVNNGKLGGTSHLLAAATAMGKPRITLPVNGGASMETGLDTALARESPCRKVFDRVKNCAGHPCVKCKDMPGTFASLFQRLSDCSNHMADRFRKSLVWIIAWHGFATLVAAVAAILPQTGLEWKVTLAALALLETVLVGLAIVRTQRLRQQEVHEHWLDARVATEQMRVLSDCGGLLDPLHPLIARKKSDWRRFAITVGLMCHSETPPPPEWRDARDMYLRNRLTGESGQINYFGGKGERAAKSYKRTLTAGWMLGIAAMLVVALAFVFKVCGIVAKIHHASFPAPLSDPAADGLSWIFAILFLLLPIALPLTAGVFISLRTALDLGRRRFRYLELADYLRSAKQELETLDTEATVRRCVERTEDTLLGELLEWHLAEQQNGAH
ncbi:MAG: hypothetical protein U1F77_19575 [Kiritimatiellia bacterium]